MKFVNNNSVSISIRHGDLKSGYYWTSVYPRQEIEMNEKEGLAYGFTKVEEQKQEIKKEKPTAFESSVNNKVVETKQEVIKKKEQKSQHKEKSHKKTN